MTDFSAQPRRMARTARHSVSTAGEPVKTPNGGNMRPYYAKFAGNFSVKYALAD